MVKKHLVLKHVKWSFFYIYVSVNRWSILIIVQRDATQSSLFIILQVHCTCFECQPHPSSGVHKTVTTASGNWSYFLCLATLEGGSCTKNMTSTGGCSYSIVYFWWWVWLVPETCRVNLQNNKYSAFFASRWTVINRVKWGVSGQLRDNQILKKSSV